MKWLSPESIRDYLYTTKSDVWSYGVLLWELATLGAPPYPGIPPENLFAMLSAGYRMTKPDGCSEEFYGIMSRCWRLNPDERPSFKDLIGWFETLLRSSSDYLEPSPVLVNNSTYLQPIEKETENDTVTAKESGGETEPLMNNSLYDRLTKVEEKRPEQQQQHRRHHYSVVKRLSAERKGEHKRRQSWHNMSEIKVCIVNDDKKKSCGKNGNMQISAV